MRIRIAFVVAVGLAAILALGATSAQQPVTVMLAGFSVDTPVVQRLIDQFVRGRVPGVNVQWQPITDDFGRFITTTLAAGTAPDIFYLDIFASAPLVRAGRIEPLDSYLRDSHRTLIIDFVPELMQAFTFERRVYAIPKDFNSLVAFYNKDMFDAAGVPYPADDDTWAAFKEKIARVHRFVNRADPGIYGMILNPDAARFIPFALANGGALFADDGSADSVNTPAWKQAADYFTSFVREGLAAPASDIGAGWPGDAFAKERAAVVLEGGWMIPFLRDTNPGLDYGTAFLPTAPTGRKANFLFTVGYAMSADGRNKPAAWRVIEALTSPEAQEFILRQGLAIPSRVVLQGSPVFLQTDPASRATAKVFSATRGAVAFRFGLLGGDYLDRVGQSLTRVFNREATPDQAMELAARQINEQLRARGLIR